MLVGVITPGLFSHLVRGVPKFLTASLLVIGMQTLPHATLDENTLDERMNEVDQMLGEGEIDPKDVPPSSTPKRGQPAEARRMRTTERDRLLARTGARRGKVARARANNRQGRQERSWTKLKGGQARQHKVR